MWCIVVDIVSRLVRLDSSLVILKILSKGSDEQFLPLLVTAVEIFPVPEEVF